MLTKPRGGRVSSLQTVTNSFDNNPSSRALQDVGLDGLSDADEKNFFKGTVTQVTGKLNTQAANTLAADPSSDDYQYYLGPPLDKANADILQRYSRYNGTDGNSPTSEQSQALLGIQTSAGNIIARCRGCEPGQQYGPG